MDVYEHIEGLTGLAVINGPFFFTLLFGLVFIKMSHAYVKSLMQRTKPPAQTYEKVMYGMFFIFSILATFGFGYESVAWWKQNQIHSYKIVIRGVQTGTTIVADIEESYIKKHFRDAGPAGPLEDYYFVILHKGPFAKDHVFSFNYYPENGSITELPVAFPLNVTYTEDGSVRYKLIDDGNKTRLNQED